MPTCYLENSTELTETVSIRDYQDCLKITNCICETIYVNCGLDRLHDIIINNTTANIILDKNKFYYMNVTNSNVQIEGIDYVEYLHLNNLNKFNASFEVKMDARIRNCKNIHLNKCLTLLLDDSAIITYSEIKALIFKKGDIDMTKLNNDSVVELDSLDGLSKTNLFHLYNLFLENNNAILIKEKPAAEDEFISYLNKYWNRIKSAKF